MTKPKRRSKATPAGDTPKRPNAKPAVVRERARAAEREYGYPPNQETTRARRPVNLTLDRDAVARGERFADRHGISVSTLVSGFLQSLPDESDAPAVSPAVKRLYGLAAGHDLSVEIHREFLAKKYGVK